MEKTNTTASQSTGTHPTYGERARLYDLIYTSWKDYDTEANKVRQRLSELGVPDDGTARLLDVACGTGLHLGALQQWFDVAGCDVNDEMIKIARERLGDDVPLWQADMRSLTLDGTPWEGRPVDAVTCLFSSIGYMPNEESLTEMARSVASCLRPGGVVVIEPFIRPTDYIGDGHVHFDKYSAEDGSLHLARMSSSGRDGNIAVIEFHWLVAREGEGVEHFQETHRLTMFTETQMLEAFRDAGFVDCHFDPSGLDEFGGSRGFLVGLRGES